ASRASFFAAIRAAPRDARLRGPFDTPESQPRTRSPPRNTGWLRPWTKDSTANVRVAVSGRGVAGGFVPGPGFLHTGHRFWLATWTGNRWPRPAFGTSGGGAGPPAFRALRCVVDCYRRPRHGRHGPNEPSRFASRRPTTPPACRLTRAPRPRFG